ncbi:MAG: HEAT repeat domain-containing protein [Planctomycetes bacterium]|jgi:hypothetical protein|nr:HEAT repeat domain-containing protein [Planctomycetota bacterium]
MNSRPARIPCLPLVLLCLALPATAGEDWENHPVPGEEKERTPEEKAGHAKAVRDLLGELGREKNKVLMLARFKELGTTGGEVGRDALIAYCQATKNQEHLCAAFLALAKLGGPKSLNFLCSRYALKSGSDWIVQRGAADALVELKDPRCACCLGDVVRDARQKTMVRGACLIALARVAREDAAEIDLVFRMADVKDDILRRDAMTALGHLRSEKSFRLLADRCRSEANGEVRGAACTALGIHGNPAGVEILREVVAKDKALQVKDAAMKAIHEIQNPGEDD